MGIARRIGEIKMTDYKFIERAAPAGVSLFFVFHGTGGDEFQLFEVAQSIMPEAHIISVRGDVSEHGALRFFKRTGEGVYDMADLAIRTTALCEFIAHHKEKTQAPCVAGLGYSNGANILASIMFKTPELFDEVVLMHPLIPWVPAEQFGLAGKRVLITAGKRDDICPAALSEGLAAYFEQQNAETKLLWHDGGHELRQTEIDGAKAFIDSNTSCS